MRMEPGGQGEVISHSPEQGHGGVAMAVDQAGHGQLSLSVYACPGYDRWTFRHRTDPVDMGAADGNKGRGDQRVYARMREKNAVGYQEIDFHNCLHKE